MMDVISSNSQMVTMRECLNSAKWVELKETESGQIFTDEYLASNWENIDVYPETLPMGEAQKGMRKVTSPVLLLKSHSPKMAFILASEDSPVYICSPFKRSKADGYTMLFNLKPFAWPEYFFYMTKYDSWTRISKDIDESEKYKLDMGFSEVGHCEFDGYREFVIDAETVFLNCLTSRTVLPPLPVQRQRIDDAKMMEKVVLDKMSERERKFQQKEWLNETHIRNCKHRLSNDIMPIRMAVDRLEKFISASTDGVKPSSIIGQATQQTVENLMTGLVDSICKIEEDIKLLTEIVSDDKQMEILDVEQFVREYCKEFVSMYNSRFHVYVDVKDGDLSIRISRGSLKELFESVFTNAVRHGFTEECRDDYAILVTISETDEGYCKIDIANNGNPISERGQKEFFVRGSFAGETGHTGLGGARIFEICERCNGKAMIPYNTGDSKVVVSVEFPIVSF